MKTRSFIGIDFGTTNTSVVRILKEEHGERMDIISEGGDYPFASLLSVSSDNKVSFGNEVKKNREKLSETDGVVYSFKSLLGTDKKTSLNGKEYSPREVVAIFLEHVKKFVQQKHNIDITQASFSFPVDFTSEARQDLRKAAGMAGISVVGFVSEPTAAYLATREKLVELSRVMVIDWGGGTLDISILEIEKGEVREVAVYGEKIGGDDIDSELAERVHSQFNLKLADDSKRMPFKDMPLVQRDKMIAACERAKIQISEDGEDYSLTVSNYGDYGRKTITVTNEMFEEVVKPIIRSRVLKTVNSAMERAELSKSGIDAVIIAGGSSNLRPFADAIINLFGEEKIVIPDKVQFVSAKGAALMQFIGGGFKLSDDVGILMIDNTVFPILKKDEATVGAQSQKFTFSLTEDAQDAHFIITNGDGRIVYDKVDVPTKGFLRERLEVSASIDEDQIAQIKIHSSAVSDDLKDTTASIRKLTFHYDLANIDD